jgi:hypothetical protein
MAPPSQELEPPANPGWFTVLVSDHYHDGDLAIGWHPALVVRLVKEGIEALHYALGDTRWLAEPYRRRDDEDVGINHPLAQRRPVIAFPLIGSDAGLDVVIDGTHHRAFPAVLRKLLE